MSFQNAQPPILLAPIASPLVSLKITGAPGNWHIRTDGVYKGWIRFALPKGARAFPTNDAADLGSLAAAVTAHQNFWTQPAPLPKSFEVLTYPGGLQATWHFERPGAEIPRSLLLAAGSGEEIKFASPVLDLHAPTSEGPKRVCTGSDLVVRFPFRPYPGQRTLVEEEPSTKTLSLQELALANLKSNFTEQQFKSLSTSTSPNPTLKLLISQSLRLTYYLRPREDKLLEEIVGRLSFGEWQPDHDGDALALACAMDDIPAHQIYGCLVHASLCGSSYLNDWQKRAGFYSLLAPIPKPAPIGGPPLGHIQVEGRFGVYQKDGRIVWQSDAKDVEKIIFITNSEYRITDPQNCWPIEIGNMEGLQSMYYHAFKPGLVSLKLVPAVRCH